MSGTSAPGQRRQIDIDDRSGRQQRNHRRQRHLGGATGQPPSSSSSTTAARTEQSSNMGDTEETVVHLNVQGNENEVVNVEKENDNQDQRSKDSGKVGDEGSKKRKPMVPR